MNTIYEMGVDSLVKSGKTWKTTWKASTQTGAPPPSQYAQKTALNTQTA